MKGGDFMAYTKGMIKQLVEKYGLYNPFTWQESGIHYATLNSLVKRGYLKKDASDKYCVSKSGYNFAQVEELAGNADFFTIYLDGKKLGMLCSLKGVDILDCWGKPYDITNNDFYFQELKFGAPKIRFEN